MGWKSTVTLTRQTAMGAIMVQIGKIPLMSDDELADLMGFFYGDDPEESYYGYNFRVDDDNPDY